MPPTELLITEVFDIFFDFTVLCNTEIFVFWLKLVSITLKLVIIYLRRRQTTIKNWNVQSKRKISRKFTRHVISLYHASRTIKLGKIHRYTERKNWENFWIWKEYSFLVKGKAASSRDVVCYVAVERVLSNQRAGWSCKSLRSITWLPWTFMQEIFRLIKVFYLRTHLKCHCKAATALFIPKKERSVLSHIFLDYRRSSKIFCSLDSAEKERALGEIFHMRQRVSLRGCIVYDYQRLDTVFLGSDRLYSERSMTNCPLLQSIDFHTCISKRCATITH